MILALGLLTAFLPGCSCFEYMKYKFSLATARLESFGPSRRVYGPCGVCSDCIPSRPFTPGYDEHHDFYITRHTAQRCAFKGLAAYRRQCRGPMSHHFKMGFIAAYEDLALNRQPAPPILPPPKYWNAFYRSPAGQPCVQDWFAGYDAGRDMGQSSGVSQFNQIAMRRFHDAACSGVPINSDPAQMDNGVYLQSRYPATTPISPVSYRYATPSQY